MGDRRDALAGVLALDLATHDPFEPVTRRGVVGRQTGGGGGEQHAAWDDRAWCLGWPWGWAYEVEFSAAHISQQEEHDLRGREQSLRGAHWKDEREAQAACLPHGSPRSHWRKRGFTASIIARSSS